MKKQFVLDESDIRERLANSFCVDPSKVNITIQHSPTGYGPDEDVEHTIRAEVTVPVNDMR